MAYLFSVILYLTVKLHSTSLSNQQLVLSLLIEKGINLEDLGLYCGIQVLTY